MELIIHQPSACPGHEPKIEPQTSATLAARPRCQYVSRNGRPCRYLAVSAKQPFCKHHLPPGSPEAVAEEFYKTARNFKSPNDVTNVLQYIFFSLLHGTISERKAGLLTYIAQTILHSYRTMGYWEKLVNEGDASDLPTEPEPAWYHRDPGDASSKANAESSPADSAASKESSPQDPPPSDSPAAQPADPPAPSRETRPSPKKATPPPPIDLNHFYPRDATIPHHLQDPNTHWIPPSQAELDRRNARFDRRHGFRRHNPHHRATLGKSDWDIINGH